MVRRGQNLDSGEAEGGGAEASTASGSRGRSDTAASGQPPAPKKHKTKEAKAAAKRAAKAKEDNIGKKYGEEVEALLTMLPVLTKLVLQNTQLLRDVASAVVTSWFIPRESAIVKAVKAAMVKYNEATQGRPGHTQGPPHLHAVLGFMEGAKQLEWGDEGKEVEAKLIELDTKFEQMEEETQHLLVPYFRVKKIQRPTDMLLQYRVTEHDSLFFEVMKKAGATLKTGRQPQGVMERLLSKALKEVASNEDKDEDMKD